MTAPQRSPSTAITLTENAAVGKLPAEIQHQLEMRKLTNQIAGKLAEMNWGKGLDLETRRAIADWGRQFRIDVTTEIDVLGSNVYLNSRFYLRRLGEMIDAELVEYAFADHIEVDDRLAKLGEEGTGEMNRRLRERITHQVPDKAVSAVVFRVKLRSMDREIVGTKWCGGRTKDPVGDQFPVETSESRAARRAMRQVAGHVPREAEEVLAVEESADALSDRMETTRREFKEREKQIAIVPKPLLAPANPASDPYALGEPQSEPRPTSVAVEYALRREQTDEELDQMRFGDD